MQTFHISVRRYYRFWKFGIKDDEHFKYKLDGSKIRGMGLLRHECTGTTHGYDAATDDGDMWHNFTFGEMDVRCVSEHR
jgi:hypothetical protein